MLGKICFPTQSDQGFPCPLTESLATTEYTNGDQRSAWYFVYAQGDLSLHILRMLEGTFSPGQPKYLSG